MDERWNSFLSKLCRKRAKKKKTRLSEPPTIRVTVVVSICYMVVCSAQPCHSFYGRTMWANRGGERGIVQNR